MATTKLSPVVEIVDNPSTSQHIPLKSRSDTEEEQKEKAELDMPENHSSSECFGLFKVKAINAIILILLFAIFWFLYFIDIATMFMLWLPAKGGGIEGCECQNINLEIDCKSCWNCVTFETISELTDYPSMNPTKSPTATDMLSSYPTMEPTLEPTLKIINCQYFDENAPFLRLYFMLLSCLCAFGLTLNESTIWFRLCRICCAYNKENVKYHEQRDKEMDEFVVKNNSKYFESMMNREEWNKGTNIQNEEEEMNDDDDEWDDDALGLIPCCFEDIDDCHMQKLLVTNDEINKKCQCPYSVIAFSISIIWLIPFRHFWSFAVCDLNSVFWQRICWFGLWHVLFFDVPWIIGCVLMHRLLIEAHHGCMDCTDFEEILGRYLQGKGGCSVAMIVIIFVVWIIVFVHRIYVSYCQKTTAHSDKK